MMKMKLMMTMAKRSGGNSQSAIATCARTSRTIGGHADPSARKHICGNLSAHIDRCARDANSPAMCVVVLRRKTSGENMKLLRSPESEESQQQKKKTHIDMLTKHIGDQRRCDRHPV